MNLRMLANRVVNFARPKPQMIPLTAGQILADNQGRDLVERANDLLYSSGAGGALNWKGMQFLKTPCDLWMYVELLQRLRPAALVETGTHQGGSATFFADMAATLGIPCTVITVDINPKWSYDPASKGIVTSNSSRSSRARVGRASAKSWPRKRSYSPKANVIVATANRHESTLTENKPTENIRSLLAAEGKKFTFDQTCSA